MTKKELINAVAERCQITKKDTEVLVNGLLDVVTETLAGGEEISIVGFGKFDVIERAERAGRNPQTGEELVIAATKAPRFKAGKALKEAVK